jgi:hypothetical protein
MDQEREDYGDDSRPARRLPRWVVEAAVAVAIFLGLVMWLVYLFPPRARE